MWPFFLVHMHPTDRFLIVQESAYEETLSQYRDQVREALSLCHHLPLVSMHLEGLDQRVSDML